MFTIDEIFDYIHRVLDLDDDCDIEVSVFRREEDNPEETTASGCSNGCCRVHLPSELPDMAFEFEDWLNDSIARFGKKYGLVSAKDFERVCGVPASFIEAVDEGEAVKWLRFHK